MSGGGRAGVLYECPDWLQDADHKVRKPFLCKVCRCYSNTVIMANASQVMWCPRDNCDGEVMYLPPKNAQFIKEPTKHSKKGGAVLAQYGDRDNGQG